jgi:hypothetical protein
MIPANTIADLATLGLTREQALAVGSMLRAVEDATREEASPAKTAKQKANANYYLKHLKKTESDNSVTESDILNQSENYLNSDIPHTCTRAPKLESTNLLSKEEKEDRKKVSKNITPIEILSDVVSAQTASDLIDHRRALKSPMTVRAAELLAKAFVAFGDPERAAQEMIARGWKGFNAEWMENNHARAGPAGRSNGMGGLTKWVLEGMGDGDDKRRGEESSAEALPLLQLGRRRD